MYADAGNLIREAGQGSFREYADAFLSQRIPCLNKPYEFKSEKKPASSALTVFFSLQSVRWAKKTLFALLTFVSFLICCRSIQKHC